MLISLLMSLMFSYYRTKGQSNMLQLQWDKMKKENKRVTKKDINI